MSIPLDQLYHYIDQCAQKSYRDIVIIYRFFPYGSKDLRDLDLLKDRHTPEDILISPELYCNDQEPLDFDRYEKETCYSQEALELLDWAVRSKLNLRDYPGNIWDYAVILHSEQRSSEVEKYCNNSFVPAYYWSHALIAQDWFRYAQHDPALNYNTDLLDSDFLIYNRAWSGTREYRLCFAEHIVETGLTQSCKMSFTPMDTDVHYSQHQFANSAFQITNFNLEGFFPTNTYHANSSADYNNQDYRHCGMEVVLETLFDDTRWHLTEKTLRPLACGKPFLLMSTAGSLQYLKQYGFKTFGDYIDESYDTIYNSHDRMQAVIVEMQRISQLDKNKKIVLWNKLHKIAQHNKSVFFEHLHTQVVDEYIANLNQAMVEMQKYCTGKYYYAAMNFFAPDSKESVWIEEQTKFNQYRPQLEQWLEQHRSR